MVKVVISTFLLKVCHLLQKVRDTVVLPLGQQGRNPIIVRNVLVIFLLQLFFKVNMSNGAEYDYVDGRKSNISMFIYLAT